MKQLYLLLLIFLICGLDLQAQSIRKNYHEMTDNEKINIVNAFYALRLGPDLVNDLAEFHGNYFNFSSTIHPLNLSIHNNLPDRPEMDIFFAWHRRQMFELEQAMQEIDPNISIPYWDTSIDQSPNSDLWDENFLGQFDSDWNLDRTFRSQSLLPTPQDITDTQEIVDFLDYSDDFERGSPHTGAHRWVSGAMATSRSPRDPVFYFHHANVDKLWSEWQEINQSSSFMMNSMVRYDGTYDFDGNTLLLLNPNDITNTRYFGTFYAENELAELDNYTVSNIHNDTEVFYYQYTIQAGNNFIVAAGTNAKFESINEIVLLPGFESVEGSAFIASIDRGQSEKRPFSKRGNEIVRNQIPFDDAGTLLNVYENLEIKNTSINLFPNPFSSSITLRLMDNVDNSEVIIYDMTGRIIRIEAINGGGEIEIINLDHMSSGIYLLKIINKNNKELFSKKIFKL